MTRPAVLPHVDQAFLHDAQNLAANPLRHIEIFQVGNKASADAGLPLKALHGVIQNPQQALRIHIDGFHLLHQFAQLEDFLPQQTLDAAQFSDPMG